MKYMYLIREKYTGIWGEEPLEITKELLEENFKTFALLTREAEDQYSSRCTDRWKRHFIDELKKKGIRTQSNVSMEVSLSLVEYNENVRQENLVFETNETIKSERGRIKQFQVVKEKRIRKNEKIPYDTADYENARAFTDVLREVIYYYMISYNEQEKESDVFLHHDLLKSRQMAISFYDKIRKYRSGITLTLAHKSQWEAYRIGTTESVMEDFLEHGRKGEEEVFRREGYDHPNIFP